MLTSLTYLYARLFRPGLAACGSLAAAEFALASALCVIRALNKNALTGPILASVTALTGLVHLCAPQSPGGAGAAGDAGVPACARSRRALGDNGVTGTVPSAVSVLTALTGLYARLFRPRPRRVR